MRILRKTSALLWLLASFLVDLIAATWGVGRIVLSPRVPTRPTIIEMRTELSKPWAVALLAYFTSLTPGSTCLHVSGDRHTLYLHVLDVADAADTLATFRRSYESPLMELER